VPANPAGLVYGTIAVAALLAAESARRETYVRTVGAVLITLVLYWLAYSYAEFTARRLRDQGRFTIAALAQTARHELSILIGATLPLLAVLILWAAGERLTAAVTAAIWTSAVTIVVIEAAIAIRARLPGRDVLRQTAMGAFLGLLVIALRVVLH
jgi:VIT1/CCC1 family predicted Fe2+/Mn2+ transporter